MNKPENMTLQATLESRTFLLVLLYLKFAHPRLITLTVGLMSLPQLSLCLLPLDRLGFATPV